MIAALNAKGLHLSPEASREVLLRRASFDLIGLPPTPDEVHEFLADHHELAYERLIERLATIPEPIRADVKQALSKPADQRTPVEKYLAEKFQGLLQPDDKTLDKLLPEAFTDYRMGLDQRNSAIAAQERQRISFDELRALYDLPGPAVTPLLRRGDALTLGPPVEPGVLTSLTTPVAFEWTQPAAEAKTSGRRLAFARWLTQPDHPLTARVMASTMVLGGVVNAVTRARARATLSAGNLSISLSNRHSPSASQLWACRCLSSYTPALWMGRNWSRLGGPLSI